MPSAASSMKRLPRSGHDAATAVVFSEIALGMTFCRVAVNFAEERRARALSLARRAYDTAVHYMSRVQLEHPEFNQMTAQAERLRFEIESLGG